ncbi:hypothetical protein J2Y45_000515 [Dyadobacter sp. BE34]|uniref:Uncharacterized protein n=1 Tax=Dyadobacter fermentans TaxID=94254 RepID=A0ABU1QSF9_9BACT|nr:MULTISPECIES: hypothetical protein [Dyadobacter]MDR6803245.1 hypothetical protein [Dyadobacter fermentans]MDR7040986.1 hypothetical protein [Dyadobacter sp. BE242]MDR7195389.1 hypothetical protein [Dyadobacter sp. BE34]MDR7214066.1 hypothetical protein [Dyadobacter sp. BE31]MDR7260796.1 hypothetical protein [Dyadobacter sp. BE32]
MDTLETSTTVAAILNDEVSYQRQLIKNFFQKDSGSEMIESLNTLIEAYLFTENLTRVTPEMREHIVNQLRVATLIAKLEASNDDIAKRSPPL